MSYNFVSLSNQLVANIQQISTNVNLLQKYVDKFGTEEDNTSFRTQLQSLQHQTNELAKQCSRDMRELSNLCHTTDHNQSKANKISCDRIRSDFMSILSKFQEIQRLAAQRVKQFPTKSPKLEINTNNPYYANDEFNFSSTTLSFKEESPAQTQTQEMRDLAEERLNVEMAQQQHEAITRLESDIQDVNTIFVELAKMVHEQQDIVDHIETNVISAQIQVETGNQQLMSAAEYQKKARKKKLWIIIILVIILVILTLIIYFSVNKK